MDAAMFLALILLLIGSVYLSISISRKLLAERLIVGYLFFVLQVLLCGYVVSALGHLNDANQWLAASVGLTLLAGWFAWWKSNRKNTEGDPRVDVDMTEAGQVEVEEPKHYPLVIVLGITVTLVFIANLLTAIFTAPHNIDSHTCHLARTAHFLQQGNLKWYPTNMWAQVSHPRNHPVLLACAWKLGGENATQLVNLSAWIMSAVCVWGIVFNLQKSRQIASVTAMLSLLLVNSMLMATTTQNDLVVAVQSGTAIYFLSAWYQSGSRRYLSLLAVPLFICIGIKASVALWIPAFLVIAAATILSRRVRHHESIFIPFVLVASSVLIAVTAALPTGYVQNIFRYGHVLGVEHVRTGHTLVGLTPQEQLEESGKNALRYLIDSTSFEGMKQGGKIDKWRDGVITTLASALKNIEVDLEANDHSKRKFFLTRPYRNHEDYSWWGIASVLLIWPSVLYSICAFERNRMAFACALAFLVFLLCQGYAQYDPWRGRYFTWATPMVVVPVAFTIKALLSNRVGQTFLMLATIAICLTSGRALLYRTNSFLVEKNQQQSIFAMDRVDQLTRNTPALADVIRAYENQVSAKAKVTLALSGNHYLFPFYGDHLQHDVSYVFPNLKAIDKASGSFDFLVFSDGGGKIVPAESDFLLGCLPNEEKIFLRRGSDREK